MRHERPARILALLAWAVTAFPSPVWAAPAPIPAADPPPPYIAQPTVPPSMEQPPAAETREYFRCNRDFVYRGKTYSCDSLVRQDGEGLRAFVSDSPQALNELDAYQNTRRKAQIAAYVGTLGIVAGIAGVLIGRAGGSTDVGNVVGWGGLALAGVGVLYGFSLIRANETHLTNAVQIHNESHPDRPIELKFTTGFAF